MSEVSGGASRTGFYERQLLPRLINLACGTRAIGDWRRAALEGASGTVVEIGFGSGTNLPHLPNDVTRVLGVEPSGVARSLAERRIAACAVPVELVGLDGEALPLENASCDTAVSTFTLCTVPEPLVALDELRRVLRPGGKLLFLEHGLSPEPKVADRQRRFDGLQARLFGGCHLTRDPVALAEAAGFEVVSSTQRYAGGGPKALSWFTQAVAVRL